MEASGHSRRRRGDGCTVVECYTPRKVVGRWLSGLRSSKGKRETGEGVEEDDTRGYKLPPIRCSTKRLNENTPETNQFESQSREAPLEMGIGSILLYLVIASKTELDKMTNLRMQMEMFLLNAKEELQKKEVEANPPMSSNEASGYQFSPQEFSNLASSIFQESSTSILLQEEYTEFEVSKPDRSSKLQAEVGRLPLDDKAEDRYTKYQIQRQRKLEENEVTKSHIPEMVVADERSGVCPFELEKKLHELLETRQQEELLKLETALSRVERRLQEKETEVSWWKDAARLLAQRVPESSRSGLEWCNPESSTCSERSVPRSYKVCSKHRTSFSR
ncbi:PREDICTED: protein POLAR LOCALIZATION DURING ASYMMETRIC DIVISION AND REDISTRIBUTION-like isoform X1 [Camelina sativa]|uniref:Protein POLAR LOCALIZATION DURING ASYMMETRIC DIVISION AND REDISTRIBUTION-like isoform X1 n=1 Tax=Camelina sativa TaxID=90675 RepID=A0ABM0UWX1_CAMSA|nr:PREDICTED: protein POLAR LOCALIZATION DURING ASYMMETRIC DIVISION AND REDISTRIBUTION-like isoform X1 [Camelina sativa]